MTLKDKQLLLKDLKQRLPYGVKGIITFNGDKDIFTIKGISNILFLSDTECCHIEDFRPYLRPMSSMTVEELMNYHDLCTWNDAECYEFGEWTKIVYTDTVESINYLNSIHVDYSGLIPKGLAIEVDKENNPYEEINL